MEENSTKTTTGTSENWLKSHMTVVIGAVVLIVAIVVGIMLITGKGGQSPEKVMETYVDAMKEGNVDKIMSVTDVKGSLAWKNCGGDASKFEEEYNKISDSDAKSYESTAKSTLETAFSLLKAFGSIEMSINNMDKPVELAKNLYKIKANVKMKVSVFGVNQEQDQDIVLAVYNGRYIGEASAE